MQKTILSAALILSLALFLTACSTLGLSSDPEMASVPYSPETIYNLDRARAFSAEGRYELAKEHYLLALAANRNPNLQDTLATELHSVDMMIKTVR